MKELTKTEENIMQILWNLRKGFVRDIIEKLPEPRPNYNTVSTITRILEKKGFVGHKAYGKSHQYFPLVSKDQYSRASLRKLMSDYFGGSFKSLVHFFSKGQNLDLNEIDEVIKMLKEISKKGK